jgi:hypothetical protein
MITATHDAWERLGAMLRQRRISLSPRYRVRELFANETGMHWRMLHDIERAKRDNFTDDTIKAIEVAYQWRPGSVARVLAGGEPDPMEVPAAPEPDPGLEFLRENWPGLVLSPRDMGLVREVWDPRVPYDLETRRNLTTAVAERAAGGSSSSTGKGSLGAA